MLGSLASKFENPCRSTFHIVLCLRIKTVLVQKKVRPIEHLFLQVYAASVQEQSVRFLDSDRVALAVCHASPPHLPLFQNEINKESGKKEHLNTNQKNTPVPVGHADDVITRLFPSLERLQCPPQGILARRCETNESSRQYLSHLWPSNTLLPSKSCPLSHNSMLISVPTQILCD